jgi:hypothetical protein
MRQDFRTAVALGGRPASLADVTSTRCPPPEKGERETSVEESSRRFRKEADASQKEHRTTSEAVAKRAGQRRLDAEDAQTRADKIDTDSRKLTRRQQS